MCALTIAAWRVDWSWMRSKACAAYQHQRERRLEVGGHVGELVLHRLEGADGLAELLAGAARRSTAMSRQRREPP